jgi:hypothetical protein
MAAYTMPSPAPSLVFSLKLFPLLSINLQRLAANEVTPSAHFGGNAFLLGQLLAHTLGEEYSSLERESIVSILNFDQVNDSLA